MESDPLLPREQAKAAFFLPAGKPTQQIRDRLIGGTISHAFIQLRYHCRIVERKIQYGHVIAVLREQVGIQNEHTLHSADAERRYEKKDSFHPQLLFRSKNPDCKALP